MKFRALGAGWPKMLVNLAGWPRLLVNLGPARGISQSSWPDLRRGGSGTGAQRWSRDQRTTARGPLLASLSQDGPEDHPPDGISPNRPAARLPATVHCPLAHDPWPLTTVFRWPGSSGSPGSWSTASGRD